jgi:hypothetical protein
MLSRLALCALFVAVISGAAAHGQAADQPPVPQTPAPRPPTAAPQPAPTATPQAPGPPRKIRGRDLNVQIDFVITDQTGTGQAEKKTVSLLAADQTMGRVRASADTNKPNVGRVATNLNVDALPTILDNDRILLEMTIEYRPLLASQSDDAQQPTNLHESLSIILINGKPLVISHAADPIRDRRMSVEVKATILK